MKFDNNKFNQKLPKVMTQWMGNNYYFHKNCIFDFDDLLELNVIKNLIFFAQKSQILSDKQQLSLFPS